MVQYYASLIRQQKLARLALIAASVSFLIGVLLPIGFGTNYQTKAPPTDRSALSATNNVPTNVLAGQKPRSDFQTAPSLQTPTAKLVSDISGVGTGILQQVEGVRSAVSQLEQQRFNITIPERFKGKTVREVELKSSDKAIALTFDDGPWPKTTLQVLEILKENKIKATFFWVGSALNEYRDIGKQVVAEGHTIANHTWSHRYHKVSQETAAQEIGDTADLIKELTGIDSPLFRPPGGVENNGLVEYAHSQDHVNVMWSSDSKDWSKPSADRIRDNVVNSAKPGRIILMHDGGGNRSATVRALPEIIATLKQRGYQFVTVPELLMMATQDTDQPEKAASPSEMENSGE
ncbi:MAG: polysaccharide deacetylase family protein [Microcoleaceae cyanobacterium]